MNALLPLDWTIVAGSKVSALPPPSESHDCREGMMAGVMMAPRGAAAGLPERLRVETADWHRKVETLADIPGRIRTRDDYIDLLGAFRQLHGGLEDQLSAPSWNRAWVNVGVDIAAHCRAGLLAEDLDDLGAPTAVAPATKPFPCFGQALGCLYVLEGSAIGGRIVAGMVHDLIGAVPTAFLSGRGRGNQWPAVRNSLRRFAAQGGDDDAVVAGALSTFELFARQFAAPVLQG